MSTTPPPRHAYPSRRIDLRRDGESLATPTTFPLVNEEPFEVIRLTLNADEWKHDVNAIGLLVSGGLDSSILLKHLLDVGRYVMPLYIRSGLCWQAAEELALKRFLSAVGARRLGPLTVLDVPLADVYGDHWSITGRDTPEAGTPDDAVFLPGRNAFLTIKAALWCQLHGINELAIATLESNPFEDANASFFAQLEQLFNAMGPTVRLVRPFADLSKQQVMEFGRSLPLDSTFSCIAPLAGAHCGHCNKCAERQEAFCLAGMRDPTQYVRAVAAELIGRKPMAMHRFSELKELRKKKLS
jgi:7-cyano-7-deazaguanine synthase